MNPPAEIRNRIAQVDDGAIWCLLNVTPETVQGDREAFLEAIDAEWQWAREDIIEERDRLASAD